jgi:uncharacterized protein
VIQSSFQYSYLWLPLIGLIIGVMGTMVGGSGGSVFPPILILLFNIHPPVAVATSLAAALPIGLVGIYAHHRKGNIQYKTALVFIVAGFAGAMTGAWLIGLFRADLLKTIFGIYTIILGVFFFLAPGQKVKKVASAGQGGNPFRSRKALSGGLFGFIAGSATGLFGTSGTAPVLVGMFNMSMPIKVVAGTSLLVVFSNTLSGFTGHLVIGQIDMTLVWLLASGSVVGAMAGPWLLGLINTTKADRYVKKPRSGLRIGLALVFVMVGVLMILD